MTCIRDCGRTPNPRLSSAVSGMAALQFPPLRSSFKPSTEVNVLSTPTPTPILLTTTGSPDDRPFSNFLRPDQGPHPAWSQGLSTPPHWSMGERVLKVDRHYDLWSVGIARERASTSTSFPPLPALAQSAAGLRAPPDVQPLRKQNLALRFIALRDCIRNAPILAREGERERKIYTRRRSMQIERMQGSMYPATVHRPDILFAVRPSCPPSVLECLSPNAVGG